MRGSVIRIALIALGVLVAAVIAMYVVGMTLPVEHVASGTRTLPSSPEAVYALVSSVEGYQRWWSDVSRVEVLSRDAVGGLTFRQHGADGAIVMQVVEQLPPTRFVTRIADPDQPFGGTWTFDIAPEGTGTRLTITERGEVYNPLFRFMSRFVFGHTSTIEGFLAAVGSELRTKN
jgi:uncharacterized protein YndB with AHSA1/START domain